MIDVEQHAARWRDACDLTIVVEPVDPLSRVEHDLGDNDEIDARADRRDDVRRIEPAVDARLDERELDAAAARIFAQDDVERVELAARGRYARAHAGIV